MSLRGGPARVGPSVRPWLASSMHEWSATAQDLFASVVSGAAQAVVALDFDGTLAPVVDDPAQAWIHERGPEVLCRIAGRVRVVAIVTGRPAAQVVELGRLEEVADDLPPGARLIVRGQYGNEHWDSTSREVTSPEVPEGLAAYAEDLQAILAQEDVDGSAVEHKGLAVAVHTRRLTDAQQAFDRLRPRLEDAAERHGLALEPGRLVLEARAPGMHKGNALREVVAQADAGAVLFAGDDLGDLEAFEAASALRDQGLATFLVCSGSAEETALAELADVVVEGPAGVLDLLSDFADDAAPAR